MAWEPARLIRPVIGPEEVGGYGVNNGIVSSVTLRYGSLQSGAAYAEVLSRRDEFAPGLDFMIRDLQRREEGRSVGQDDVHAYIQLLKTRVLPPDSKTAYLRWRGELMPANLVWRAEYGAAILRLSSMTVALAFRAFPADRLELDLWQGSLRSLHDILPAD